MTSKLNWADRYFLVAGLLACVVLILGWFAASYLGWQVNEILSTGVKDFPCPEPETGFGVHCFSDYFSPVLDLASGDPWSRGLLYSPAGVLLFRPFMMLADISGDTHVGLLAFLVAIGACMLVPAIWAAGRRPKLGGVTILLVGVGTTPFLTTIDRANAVAFLVPPLLIFSLGFLRQKYMWVVVAVVLASCVKPQFALLMLAFIAVRQWKYLGIAAGATVLANLAAFPIVMGISMDTVRPWLGSMQGWASAIEVQTVGSGNLSFAKMLLDAVQLVVPGADEGNPIIGFITTRWLVLGVILIAATAGIFFWLGRDLSRLSIVIWCMTVAAFIVSISYFYYGVFALVIGALLVADPREPQILEDGGVLDVEPAGSADTRSGLRESAFAWMVIAATAITLFQLPVPVDMLGVPGAQPYSSLSRIVITPAWILVFVLAVAGALARRRKGARAHEDASALSRNVSPQA